MEAAWAVQAAWPLKVTGTLPDDETSDVPRDTGIEITFDQAGVRLEDLREHLTISPPVVGELEAHGLTFAYVPARPLQLPQTVLHRREVTSSLSPSALPTSRIALRWR